MRITADPHDPDYARGHAYTVVLNGRFFMQGPIIEADDRAGTIDFYPVDENGNYRFDQTTGTWKRERVVGNVYIYQDVAIC
jgi:hypothetical protein